ncbi:MAG: MotA/TolQ/ExbB proton channel family protein [Elusimicrobia bacterium]|nr:MotA/TolQ/ExbB proton channel family protein [Elusimicrobiota bacterium]
MAVVTSLQSPNPNLLSAVIMDILTLLGLALGLGAVYIVMYHGGIVGLLVNPWAAILVFGGTVGATLISVPWGQLKTALRASFFIVFPKRYTQRPEVITNTLIALCEKAKRSGIDSLQEDIANMDDRFLKEGIQLLIDGISPDLIRDNLETEIVFIRKRHNANASVFRIMGTYAPIFGLLGTLIGVVQVLKNLADPKTMGASMAIAVTTTFYGIFSTNFIFLPIASKLNALSEAEILSKEVVIEGILSIQAGDIPLILRRKLEAYLAYRVRQK